MVTKKQKRINWILVAILLVLSIFFLFPVIWMLANSFNGGHEFHRGFHTAGTKRKLL